LQRLVERYDQALSMYQRAYETMDSDNQHAVDKLIIDTRNSRNQANEALSALSAHSTQNVKTAQVENDNLFNGIITNDNLDQAIEYYKNKEDISLFNSNFVENKSWENIQARDVHVNMDHERLKNKEFFFQKIEIGNLDLIFSKNQGSEENKSFNASELLSQIQIPFAIDTFKIKLFFNTSIYLSSW